MTDTSWIDFSTTVIAYPEPRYELRYENGTTSNKMMGSITRNAVNNFTIRLYQTSVEQADFGTYRLLVSNQFGKTVVVLNVLPLSEFLCNLLTLYKMSLRLITTPIETNLKQLKFNSKFTSTSNTCTCMSHCVIFYYSHFFLIF